MEEECWLLVEEVVEVVMSVVVVVGCVAPAVR